MLATLSAHINRYILKGCPDLTENVEHYLKKENSIKLYTKTELYIKTEFFLFIFCFSFLKKKKTTVPRISIYVFAIDAKPFKI